MPKLILPVPRDIDFNGTPTRVFVLELKHDNDSLYFECTAENGGLITTFSRNGHNILTGPEVNPRCFGSTFWTSPQSDWDWPPPDEFDEMTWTARINEDTGEIKMTSPVIPSLGLQIIKRYTALPEQLAIQIDYTIINVGESPAKVAHWEISRVAPGGVTFFPRGDGDISCGDKLPIPIIEEDGILWFQHDERITSHHKLFSDGAEGWIAHSDGRLLLVKTFQDEPAERAAPGESEIEIYAAPGYVEVEQQGPFLSIPIGEQRTWQVVWRLKAHSVGTDTQQERAELLRLARS